jgi:hypothetical protein
MAKQSFKSKAINAVISAIVRTLLSWAEEWSEDAFFFLVIGDKTCTDVAWHNTEDLSCDGALAITDDVQAAAAFQDLAASVDLLVGDRLKEEDDFRKAFEESCPEKDDTGWVSMEQTD